MADVVKTKLFKNGGSLAVRIPAGWLEAESQIKLIREPATGRIYLTQDLDEDPEAFFNFMQNRTYAPDAGFAELSNRIDVARANRLSDES